MKVRIVVPSIGKELNHILRQYLVKKVEPAWRQDLAIILIEVRNLHEKHLRKAAYLHASKEVERAINLLRNLQESLADFSDVANEELKFYLDSAGDSPTEILDSLGAKLANAQTDIDSECKQPLPGAPKKSDHGDHFIVGLRAIYDACRKRPARWPFSKFVVDVQGAIFKDHGWYLPVTSKLAGKYPRIELPSDHWAKATGGDSLFVE